MPKGVSIWRVLTEGLVIVGSILFAFSIDAWWAGRQDQKQAEALLVALLEDFEAAQVMLDTVEAETTHLEGNGRRLIELSEQGSVSPIYSEQVDSLLGSHFLRPVFEPPMGMVESLLASARPNLFGNGLLVASLTSWTSAVASLQRTQADVRQHFYERLYPYLATRTDIEDLDKGFGSYLGHPLPFEQDPTDAYLLIGDLELENILYTHWVLNTNVLEIEMPRVRRALEEIRQLIREELGERLQS